MYYSPAGYAYTQYWLEVVRKLRKRHVYWIFILLTHAPLSWAQPTDQVDILTLERALRAAEMRSQSLISRQALTESAQELAVVARQLPDPVLRLSFDNVTVEGLERWSWRHEPMTMASIGLMQTLTREDKREARAVRFQQEVALAEAGQLERLTGLQRDTALAWLERYYRGRMVLLLRQQHTSIAQLLEATETAYRAGRNLQADVLMARLGVARVDDRIREAEIFLRLSETALLRWTGIDVSIPLGPLPSFSVTRLQTTDLEHELLRHPELLLLAEQATAAGAEVELARENRREDWSVELTISQRGPGFGSMVSLGFSRPLQLWQANKQERELVARLAQAESVSREHAELLREYHAMVQSWLQHWLGNLERLSSYGSTLIPLAENQAAAALSAYGSGNATLSAVFEARRAEIDVRLEHLALEMDTATLWARLEYLVPLESPTSGMNTDSNTLED